jgi:hypothetical protein
MTFNESANWSADDTIFVEPTLFGVEDSRYEVPLEQWELADFLDLVSIDAE